MVQNLYWNRPPYCTEVVKAQSACSVCTQIGLSSTLLSRNGHVPILLPCREVRFSHIISNSSEHWLYKETVIHIYITLLQSITWLWLKINENVAIYASNKPHTNLIINITYRKFIKSNANIEKRTLIYWKRSKTELYSTRPVTSD